jgi:hypothetical protein
VVRIPAGEFTCGADLGARATLTWEKSETPSRAADGAAGYPISDAPVRRPRRLDEPLVLSISPKR